MKVKVYRNLIKKCLSIQHDGKVIMHSDSVTLENVQFKVSEAGRQRVLATGHKNVHAKVVGDFVSLDVEDLGEDTTCVSYNPRKHAFFFEKETGVSVFYADKCTIDKNGVIKCIGLRYEQQEEK